MIVSIEEPRGDTIIEVLLAMTILTLILFTSWGLVNRSTRASLAARKRIEVVNQMKEQAEILKSRYAQYQKTDLKESFAKYLNGVLDSNTNYEANFCNQNNILAQTNTFNFSDSADSVIDSKKISDNGSVAVWVEKSSSVDGYDDFYIRGCWLTSGGSQKSDNSQFIVRLNR